ncbi:serine hydrolase domain-containing protein [Dokdonia sp. Hel_I_53]|uniref:serine hydrolase domain-containing protein n=1 Tax=Dokdonia sp. Hel_I_53 TaxID=1566287 RepID=UPI00119965C7|nr:serine hydrolase [Dokdonia sp. Hel_I_53]TVZ52564.1 CubicO group peptidase (beta-lactamase class C family) [Dokdonia sp. Hel_I_53]
MKHLKSFFKILLSFIVLIVIVLYITDYDYILKGVRVVYGTGHTTAFIDDYTYFENAEIQNGNPKPWPKHKNYNTATPTESLLKNNSELGTVAFLIIKNDSILYEDYANSYSAASKTNSFSMAKSITSALLGKAIQDGYIDDLNQPVGDFYKEFKNTKMTVGDLSSMASGLNWDESYTSPFSVTARSYYDDDLAETILNLKVTEEPGKEVTYLSGNTQLLGMVIQEASGKKLATYLSESFWKPMGMEQSALWQLDDNENQLAKTYCCIASNARDFARFGKLYKDNGRWGGKQLIPSGFVAKSINPRFEKNDDYGYGFWLSDYKDKEIFAMRGILGQYVITIPEDNLIIVRLGHQRGASLEGKSFTKDFYDYIDAAYTMTHLN